MERLIKQTGWGYVLTLRNDDGMVIGQVDHYDDDAAWDEDRWRGHDPSDDDEETGIYAGYGDYDGRDDYDDYDDYDGYDERDREDLELIRMFETAQIV